MYVLRLFICFSIVGASIQNHTIKKTICHLELEGNEDTCVTENRLIGPRYLDHPERIQNVGECQCVCISPAHLFFLALEHRKGESVMYAILHVCRAATFSTYTLKLRTFCESRGGEWCNVRPEII